MRMKRLIIAFALSMTAAYAHAGLLRYECSFVFVCTEFGDCGSSDFELNFMIDTVTGEAKTVGNNGFSDVYLVSGYNSISLIEPLPTGAVQTTTIIENGHALHSRHTVIAGTFTNSQYHGSCGRTGQ